jgi:hypothetical protein
MEENKGEGIMDMVTLGYDAVDKNRALEEYSEENYVDGLEKTMSGTLKITSYEFNKARSDEKKVSERIGFEMEGMLQGEMVYINPFFIRFFNENPFLMEDRTYPIDFGYPRNYRYQINISLPEGYQVQQLPEDQIVKLGENLATLKFYHQQDGDQIGIFFDLALNNSYIAAEDYGALKNLFKHVTDIQKNSLVVLRKQ